MIDNAKPKMNIPRLVVCVVLMSLIMVIMLYLYCNQVQSIIDELDADSNPMDNFIWVVRHVALLLPCIALAIFLLVVYSGEGERSAFHREQRLEYILTAAVTFFVILPVVYKLSGSAEAAEEAKNAQTLMEQTYTWFATQMIPFVILIMYHSVRYRAELEEKGKEVT